MAVGERVTVVFVGDSNGGGGGGGCLNGGGGDYLNGNGWGFKRWR